MPSETTLVNLTGWVRPELAERVKAAAAREKRTVSWIVGEALQAWLDRADTGSKP